MRGSIRLIFLIAVFTTLTCWAGAQIFLRLQSQEVDFHAIAEQKVSEFLKAQVSIGDIQIGLMNQVALSGLQIDHGSESDNPFQFQIDQIVFRYSIFKLLTKSLQSPASILLKAPKLILQDVNFPYDVLEDLNFGSGRQSVSTLKLEGGDVRYYLSRLRTEIHLSDINGILRPVGIGKIMADFEAQASGFINGKVRIKGEIDPIKRAHRLNIYLESAQFSKKVNVPLKAIEGTVRWVDGDLFFDDIFADIHGWETKIQGSMKNLEAGQQPAVILDAQVGKRNALAQVSLKADLQTHELQGAVRPFSSKPYAFEGLIEQQGEAFLFDEIRLDTGHVGSGKLDYGSGDYLFDFEKENQRIGVESNLNQLDFHLGLNLNHVNFYGMDLVTLATIKIKKNTKKGNGEKSEFEGQFQTEYFILEQAPFNDFQGGFEVNRSGIRNFRSTWGNVFRFDGNVFFRPGGPEGQLALRIQGYDLAEVKQIAGQKLPKNIGGILEGKLRLEGPLKKPEVFGDLTVKKGWSGRLEYDRAIIHFRGFPPYLALHDSKVLKGRTTLSLKGALDFSLEKFYYGISLQSSDKIVLWKGWEVNANEKEGDLEFDRLLGVFPRLSLKAGVDSGTAIRNPDGTQEDQYVVVGSKLKF